MSAEHAFEVGLHSDDGGIALTCGCGNEIGVHLVDGYTMERASCTECGSYIERKRSTQEEGDGDG